MNNERPSWQRRAVVLPVVTALVLAFQLAPIVFVVIFSFNEGRSIGSFTTWSVRWYESLFANESLLESLWLSTWVAFVVAVIATFVGTALALALSRLRRAEAAVPGGLLGLVFVTPEIALGVSLLLLFSTAGLTLSPVTIIVGHVTFCIAYVAFVVRARLETLRPDVEEAARDLGATLFGVVRLVILPQIAPAAIVAFALAFLLSFDDFVVSFFASGVDISPLPVYIYGMLRLGVTPEINAIGTIMIAAALLLGVIGFVVALRRGIVKQMTGAAQGD